MKKTILLLTGIVALNFYNQAQTISDIDGNVYNIVTIGTQTWMTENLKTSKLKDGTEIPKVSDVLIWVNLKTPAYCYENSNTYETYGALYNWYTVNTEKLCPIDWHVPSYAEWTVLTDYLKKNGYGYKGDNSAIGKSMASKSGWLPAINVGGVGDDQESNNSSGFTGLPGGKGFFYGKFVDIGLVGNWWSSSETALGTAWYRYLDYNSRGVYSYDNAKIIGMSVRCIIDSTALGTPIPNSPPDKSTDQLNNLTLKWSTSNNAESYSLQVSETYDFINTFVNDSGMTSKSKVLSGLKDNTIYYWRIRAKNSSRSSAWSSIWSFTTKKSVDINNSNFKGQIKFYPNPIINELYFEGIENEVTAITIYSMDGKLLKQFTNMEIKKINISDLQKGLYLINVVNSKLMITTKLVKQ